VSRQRGFKGPAGSLPVLETDEIAEDLAMLIEGETSGRDLDEVVVEFGRSHSTYYEKLQRYRERGIEGLLPRKSGPREPWKLTLGTAAKIVRLRMQNPQRTAQSIAEAVSRDGLPLSERSVERVLSLFGLTHSADSGT
jgi:transposase